MHAPQSSMLPQPSGTVPQFLPCASHGLGRQPHTLAVPPPPQTSPFLHVPQLSVPLQPSEMMPQFLCCEAQSVELLQPLSRPPHTLGPPPPQALSTQLPPLHEVVPPQPSGAVPQSPLHCIFMQPHT